ncbi:c-type cytochrome [Celeribacter litoreus]|uniref:c-type cytochrome n=1 Tax=Celeribacter litoreus TaxID=2876714 RepID=UPI001CC9D61F|nr:cytochrome c [Celeribacter litoreus]MCA0043544.1 cytochrome c [Celeribacter litoreus]
MKALNIFTYIAALCLPLAATAQNPEIGEKLYTQYCATCHGVDGTGEGPLAELLTMTPADLTQLSADNVAAPGEFPLLRVIHVIDGRTGVRAHGGTMPTYGEVFMTETTGDLEEVGAVIETRGRILSLAMYLESIQK